MAKNKLKRFRENEQSPNLIQQGKELYSKVKGKWNTLYFRQEAPIVLEIGCGNGEYSVGLAQIYPDNNFIGIDIKGSRMYVGSQQALELGLTNVAFLRTRVEYVLEFFEPGEVDALWITFPDPRPKEGYEKHRLIHPRFLALYRQFLKIEGQIILKTDSTLLYEYALQLAAEGHILLKEHTMDLYNSPLRDIAHGIQTKYESIFHAKGESIKLVVFTLPSTN